MGDCMQQLYDTNAQGRLCPDVKALWGKEDVACASTEAVSGSLTLLLISLDAKNIWKNGLLFQCIL